MSGDIDAVREILIRRLGADGARALLDLADAPDDAGLALTGLPVRVAPQAPARRAPAPADVDTEDPPTLIR